jgi:DNA-binding beta-propeller fold protein YncE
VVFPPASASVDGETVTVRGTAAVDSGTVAAVRVNGVEAASSDGFLTWTVTVPLGPGTTDLVVETETDRGTVDPQAASVPVTRRGGFQVLALPGGGPLAAAFEPGRGFAWIWNPDPTQPRYSATLVRVDLATGERLTAWKRNDLTARMSGGMAIDPAARALYYVAAVNIGNPFAGATLRRLDLETFTETTIATAGPVPLPWAPSRITLDATANRLLLRQAGAGTATVTAVDLATGALTQLAGPQSGSGPPLPFTDGPVAVLVAPGGRLFVCGQPFQAFPAPVIFEIDETTLARSTVPVSWPVGAGRFSGAAYDPALDRLVVLLSDGAQIRLYLLDPDTGNLTGAATLPVQSVYSLRTPLRREDGRLFFIDDVGIKEIDLAAGTVSLLADLTTEDWAPFDVAVPHDPADSSIVVTDYGAVLSSGSDPRLFRWDFETGAVTEVSSDATAGNALLTPSTLSLADGATVYFRSRQSVASLDPAGNATLLSYAGSTPAGLIPPVGSGPMLFGGGDLAVDPGATTAWTQGSNEFLEIDLATGDRTALPSTTIFAPMGLSWDSRTGKLVVADSDGALDFDPVTRTTTLIAAPDPLVPGPTPTWVQASDVAPDPESDVVYATDALLDRIVAIDRSTGSVSLLVDRLGTGRISRVTRSGLLFVARPFTGGSYNLRHLGVVDVVTGAWCILDAPPLP